METVLVENNVQGLDNSVLPETKKFERYDGLTVAAYKGEIPFTAEVAEQLVAGFANFAECFKNDLPVTTPSGMLTVLEKCFDKFTYTQLREIDRIALSAIQVVGDRLDDEWFATGIDAGRAAEQQMLDRLQDVSKYVINKFNENVK